MGAESLKFTGSFPAAPKHFGASGKEMWAKGKTLWLEGGLTSRDLDGWQKLCEAFDEIDVCDRAIKRDGRYHASAQGGMTQHPAIRDKRAAQAEILRYFKLFGLVPDARRKRPAVQQGVTSRKR
jgi:P27 family predicted phage terminase small subunit